jgi:hypothetical protein
VSALARIEARPISFKGISFIFTRINRGERLGGDFKRSRKTYIILKVTTPPNAYNSQHHTC